jgi:hypothetical protein
LHQVTRERIGPWMERDIGAKFTLDFGFEGESTFFVDLLLHVKPQEKAA